ncbi:MAG: hypothetical protein MJ176_03025 [Treponema sp.]|nr:hypothetical protein [Treponema sp.]
MTDEEKAEEYANACRGTIKDIHWQDVRYAVLYGLAEGKPKWHDLREDPNDLPKHDTEDEENNFYLVAFRNYFNHEEIIVREFLWSGAEFREEDNSEIPYFKEKGILVAWCELPKFVEK